MFDLRLNSKEILKHLRLQQSSPPPEELQRRRRASISARRTKMTERRLREVWEEMDEATAQTPQKELHNEHER